MVNNSRFLVLPWVRVQNLASRARRLAADWHRAYSGEKATYEVDFLARAADGSMELIQVCADPSDAITAARELRALAAAGEQFPHARKRLITLTSDRIPDDMPAGVEAQSAAEWLLAPYR